MIGHPLKVQGLVDEIEDGEVVLRKVQRPYV